MADTNTIENRINIFRKNFNGSITPVGMAVILETELNHFIALVEFHFSKVCMENERLSDNDWIDFLSCTDYEYFHNENAKKVVQILKNNAWEAMIREKYL